MLKLSSKNWVPTVYSICDFTKSSSMYDLLYSQKLCRTKHAFKQPQVLSLIASPFFL